MKYKLMIIAAVSVGLVLMYLAIDAYLSSGSVHRKIAEYTGYSTICVDGVKYVQFTSGASVQYDTNGKVVTCR